MKIIIGLGNPESRYNNTRHNIGFSYLDSYARDFGINFKEHSKFKSLIAEHKSSEKILLVKPLTYYNDSGMAARALIDFYKVDASDIIVIHDDLALPLGSVRTRIGGSSAGNNGIKSINAAVGETTARIRIGIWSEHRNVVGDVDFVLGTFSHEESKVLEELTPRVHSLLDSFVANKFELTTHKN